MSVITNKQKVLLANKFIEQGPLTLGIGKSDVWLSPYNDNFPEPASAATEIFDDVIAYKFIGAGAVIDDVRQTTIAYAKVDNENGTVEYQGSLYRITTSFSEALNDPTGPFTSVYIKATLIRNEVDTTTSFRKVGVFLDTDATYDANGIALPGDVTSQGTLIIIDNRKPLFRNADQSEVLELMIPF
jgi:hypothetical protein